MVKNCKKCGGEFEPKNPKGKFCSNKCKVYWHRANPKVTLKNFNEQSKGTVKIVEKKAAKNESIDTSDMPDPKKDRAAFAKWMRNH